MQICPVTAVHFGGGKESVIGEGGVRSSAATGLHRPAGGRKRAAWVVLVSSVALAMITVGAYNQAPVGNPFAPKLSRRWFLDPIERNSVLRLPTIPTFLNCVTFAGDGLRGWVVGSGGTILASSDAGRSWTSQASGIKSNLTFITRSSDGLRGWAVGSGGTVLTTSDAGRSWSSRASGTQSNLASITFASDGHHGWAVGSGGTILVTSDAGNSWTPQLSATNSDLTSITFASDGLHGWTVGSTGTILATSDAGNSWTPQLSATNSNLTSITFVRDGLRGWAVGEAGIILATSDAGHSWTPQASGTRDVLNSVAFADDGLRGWAASLGHTILATSDAGRSWTAQASATDSNLTSVTFAEDGLRGWAVGSGGTILTTSDAGHLWTAQTSGSYSFLISVKFASDGLRGWAVGEGGAILATSDAGYSWTPQGSGSDDILNSVAFSSDGLRGWAVAEIGGILSTSNGGRSWTQQPLLAKRFWNSVTSTSDGLRGWAVGSEGTILATSDGGRSWISQASGTNTSLESVALVGDGLRGWIVGRAGTILATSDGGHSWTSQASHTGLDLLSVAFAANGRSGWAVGTDGTLLATTDAGQNWTPQTSGTHDGLKSITFAGDGRTGWAVGTSGTILTTSDAGRTWTPQASGTTTELSSVTFADDGLRGCVVGWGAILVTNDAGVHWRLIEYSRSNAPWFWLLAFVLVSACAVLVHGSLRTRDARVASIVDRGEADEPISSAPEDRLGSVALARGLALYLRNIETRPPLTVAIDAPWGRGKSSVMRILRGELEATGLRPIWFNAWHHQDEGLMLASLLQQIRADSLPPALSLWGIRFRLRLLWRRTCYHPWRALFLGGALCAAAAHFVVPLIARIGHWADGGDVSRSAIEDLAHLWRSVVGHDVPRKLFAGNISEFIGAAVASLFATPESLASLLLLFVLVSAIWAIHQYGVRAFPDSPAVLLATLSSRFRLSDAKAQTEFRQRFHRHFADVCDALKPRPITIFIDDLDRCDPIKAAEMLEAINYLVNSGPCFVILGIAREVVEAQLMTHYAALADAVTQVENASPLDARTARLGFVRSYLRKLINLQVHIPPLSPDQVRALLNAQEPTTSVPTQASDGWRPRILRIWRSIRLSWSILRRPLFWMITVGFAVYAGIDVWRAGEEWNAERDKAMEVHAAGENETLDEMKKAEHRALAAVDYARGKEKAAAGLVLEQSGIPLGSLATDAPSNARERVGGKNLVACPDSQDQDPIACWKRRALDARAVEGELTAIKAARITAETARALDSKWFDQEANRVLTSAETAERLAGLSPVPSGPNPRPGPNAPSQSVRNVGHVDEPVIEVHHASDKPRAPLLLGAILAVLSLWIILRPDDYPIEDAPEFTRALQLWSPFIISQSDLAAPREVKRFLNMARYCAMRLRPPLPTRDWLERRLSSSATFQAEAKSSLPEPTIVGLAAIAHVCPDWLHAGRLSDIATGTTSTGKPALEITLRDFLRQHAARFGQRLDEAEIGIFLAAAGEYAKPDDLPAPLHALAAD